MDLTQLANLGEFIGGVAVLVTLVYLVIQVKQGNTTSRAAARQTLIDTMYSYAFEIARDEDLTRIQGEGTVDYEDLSESDKARFTLMQARFLGNVHNGLQLHKDGLLDRATLDSIAGYLASAVVCRGGAVWWERFPVLPEVRDYMTEFIERQGDGVVPYDQLLPDVYRTWSTTSTANPTLAGGPAPEDA